jgi:exodeoxyribonuclease VII small subunit
MEKSFESQLKELEQIVNKLEAGDLPLEESLKLFEDGVRLSRECRERLTLAERRIEVLLKDSDGNLSVKAIDPAGMSADSDREARKRIVFGNDDDAPL